MFSVIIPVHNKFPHLDRSVNSVLNQTYKDFELILIDDASNDGSEEKIYEYKDPRIKCYQRNLPGPGGYAGRNLGIEKANYEWIAFLDADDEWHKDYLHERADLLEKNVGVDVISSKYLTQGRSGVQTVREVHGFTKYHSTFVLSDYLENYGLVWTGSVTIRKSLLLEVGGFPDGKCKRGGDLDTWIRCLYRSKKSIFINKSLSVYYRDTVNQVTDHSTNPSLTFCAAETLSAIRGENNDIELLDAIDKFIGQNVYNILRRTRNLDANYKIYLLSLIHSRTLKLKLKFKLYFVSLLIIMKLKK